MQKTNVRHAVLLATTLAAFLMYVDRICIGWILSSESFQAEIQLDRPPKTDLETTNASPPAEPPPKPREEPQKNAILMAFFWAYALGQVPAGWLSERFGKRTLMSVLILLWSAFTALMSFAESFEMLLLARIGCGLAQAGAYPIASSLIAQWAHPGWRGMASSIVSLGGRLGLVLAPVLTGFIITQFDNWRMAGWIYGATGIGMAAAFWMIFRETPAEHPRCNEAEINYLNEGRIARQTLSPAKFPLFALLTDTSLWLMCAVQFLTNVGWVFVANTLPGYFKNVLHLSDEQNGIISTVTLMVSFFGLPLGGLLTDFASRKLGIRQGRMWPIVITRLVSAGFFVACLASANPWYLAACLGLMAFTGDAGIPAMWAYAQDVGGRQVAPILGWANMWGNFGAALQPLFIGYVLKYWDTGNFHAAFLFSAGALALGGVRALGINAARPVSLD